MTDTPKLPLNSYVELLPGFEEVYNDAPTLARGFVRFAADDDFGFPKVYIEWDKDHWRYSGQKDGWTYASHFRVLDKTEPEDLVGSDTPIIDEFFTEEEQVKRVEEYLDSIMNGFDAAAESNGFYLITMRKFWDEDLGADIVIFDTHRGASDEDLIKLPESELLQFVEELKRRKGR